jgi:hypothetical protein
MDKVISVFVILALVLFFTLLNAVLIMWLWNIVAVYFGLKTITMMVALAISALLSALRAVFR